MPRWRWQTGKAVDQKVYIPFQLVTPANIGDFLSKN